MSSWLLVAAGGAAGSGGGGAAFATVSGIFGEGRSFITGDFGAGGIAAGFSGFTAVGGGAGGPPEGLSAAGGFASSSAMMRRIDARISSIEGSWTFAGCVISDSKSSTPSQRPFYTKLHGIADSGALARQFDRTGTTCPQITCRSNHRAIPPPAARDTEALRPRK